VQPYSAGSTQHARTIPPFNLDSLPDLVALARHMLPKNVAVQVLALVPAGLATRFTDPSSFKTIRNSTRGPPFDDPFFS
jgi:hypothetical protein